MRAGPGHVPGILLCLHITPRFFFNDGETKCKFQIWVRLGRAKSSVAFARAPEASQRAGQRLCPSGPIQEAAYGESGSTEAEQQLKAGWGRTPQRDPIQGHNRS